MKKQIIKICAILVAIMVFASCNTEENQIKTVSLKFLNAMKDLDFKKAKECVTPETTKMLDIYVQLVGNDTSIINKAREEAKGMEVKIIEVKIENNQANVTYEVDDSNTKTSNDKSPKTEVLKLKKADGKWLVSQ